MKDLNYNSEVVNENHNETATYLSLIENFKHEAEDPSYLEISNITHPSLFNNLLSKAHSIYSENDFSHTCKTKIKSSLLHNFQYKFFVCMLTLVPQLI